MDGFRPFRPEGACYALGASNAAPSGATFIAASGAGDASFLIYNSGANDAFLAMGPTSAAAVASAVIPLIGVPANVIPCPGKTIQTFSFTGPGTFVAGITLAGAGTIYLIPGDGT